MTSVALSDWLVDTTKITRALNCKHNVMNGEGGTRESTSLSLYKRVNKRALSWYYMTKDCDDWSIFSQK